MKAKKGWRRQYLGCVSVSKCLKQLDPHLFGLQDPDPFKNNKDPNISLAKLYLFYEKPLKFF